MFLVNSLLICLLQLRDALRYIFYNNMSKNIIKMHGYQKHLVENNTAKDFD